MRTYYLLNTITKENWVPYSYMTEKSASAGASAIVKNLGVRAQVRAEQRLSCRKHFSQPNVCLFPTN